MITEVASAYTYRDKAAVLAYLHDYPRAVPSLLEASRIIPRYFAGNPSVVLDVVIDPEAPGARSLFALIETTLQPDDALPLLDKFNDGWWRAASANVEANLHFGLDYV